MYVIEKTPTYVHCEYCGEEIYIGEEVYSTPDGYIHEACMTDYAVQVMKSQSTLKTYEGEKA